MTPEEVWVHVVCATLKGTAGERTYEHSPEGPKPEAAADRAVNIADWVAEAYKQRRRGVRGLR